MLESGKIKDEKRVKAFEQAIVGFDQQLEDIENGKKPEGPNPYSLTSSPKNSQSFKVTGASGLSPAKRFKTIRKAEKKKLTTEEQRERSLQEIFYFYARQHIQHNMPFHEMEEELKKIDLGEFSCIIRDF